jgi:hypothetical protein
VPDQFVPGLLEDLQVQHGLMARMSTFVEHGKEYSASLAYSGSLQLMEASVIIAA